MPGDVLHFATPEMDALEFEALRNLCAHQGGHAHKLLVMGAGAWRFPELTPAAHVRAPFDVSWLAAGRLAREMERLRPAVAHAWTPRALEWCLSADWGIAPIVAQADAGTDAERLGRWYAARGRTDGGSPAQTGDGSQARVGGSPARVGFVCTTLLGRRRLIEHGVSPDDCVVIREAVDFGRINDARKAEVRVRLFPAGGPPVALTPLPVALTPPPVALTLPPAALILPPVRRECGAFEALWAAMLVRVVRPDLRIVVPGGGAEVERLERLVIETRFGDAAVFCGDEFTLPELLTAADVALFLPPGDAPISSLPWAMAAGVPVVGSAVHCVAEMLADRHNAWLCKPGEPRAAARRILTALESPEKARELTALARTQAYEVFGRQRMIRQYDAAYENIIAGRPIGTGIDDAAMIR